MRGVVVKTCGGGEKQVTGVKNTCMLTQWCGDGSSGVVVHAC